MRLVWAIAAVAAAVTACSSGPPDGSVLTLNNRYWDRVNVETVVTRRDDCDSRAEGFIATRQFVLRKGEGEPIEVPTGATVCWRHDRDPNHPAAGAWSGWSRAALTGQSAETDL